MIRANLTWKPADQANLRQSIYVNITEPDGTSRVIEEDLKIQNAYYYPLVLVEGSFVTYAITTTTPDGRQSVSDSFYFTANKTMAPNPATNLGVEVINFNDRSEPSGVAYKPFPKVAVVNKPTVLKGTAVVDLQKEQDGKFPGSAGGTPIVN